MSIRYDSILERTITVLFKQNQEVKRTMEIKFQSDILSKCCDRLMTDYIDNVIIALRKAESVEVQNGLFLAHRFANKMQK